MSQARRFEDHYRMSRMSETMPGPGDYQPANELTDRVAKMNRYRIRKPKLIDEHCYEIVNGH